MTDQDNRESSWYLGSTPSSPPLTGRWALRFGEAISDDEYLSHQTSAGLINETITNSSFADLQRRCDRLKETLIEVGNAFSARRATPQVTQSIANDLDDALTALRRFADRTAHALSERFGKKSLEYSTFIQALSYEFDNEFAYRFAWHLRRYSDHQGSVPFSIKEQSRLNHNETVERQFWVVLDSNNLLGRHDWHSLVRPDLERINGEFPLGPVIDRLSSSCSHAYSKILMAQESLIVDAIVNIRNLAARAAPTDDLAPIFIKASSAGMSPVTISPISTELADVAESTLQQARVIAA